MKLLAAVKRCKGEQRFSNKRHKNEIGIINLYDKI